jgi:molybdopterin-binding protein
MTSANSAGSTECDFQFSQEQQRMKISARNILSASVKAVTPGAVDTEVIVQLAGAKAYAIIKASNVMIGVD